SREQVVENGFTHLKKEIIVVDRSDPCTHRLPLSRTKLGLGLFLVILSFLTEGCGTIRSHISDVMDLPPTGRSFPPVKPGLVRLPVIVVFPQGGDIFQHMLNLVKGGIKQVAQETVIKSRLRGLWGKMQSPILMDKDLWLLIRPTS